MWVSSTMPDQAALIWLSTFVFFSAGQICHFRPRLLSVNHVARIPLQRCYLIRTIQKIAWNSAKIEWNFHHLDCKLAPGCHVITHASSIIWLWCKFNQFGGVELKQLFTNLTTPHVNCTRVPLFLRLTWLDSTDQSHSEDSQFGDDWTQKTKLYSKC